MFIGPARDATVLEVCVVDGEDGHGIVHTMAARPKYLRSPWNLSWNPRGGSCVLGKMVASNASTSVRPVLPGWVIVRPLLAAYSPAPGGGRYRVRSVTRSRVSWVCCQRRVVKNRTAPEGRWAPPARCSSGLRGLRSRG
jgi:hypothetical protein